MAFSCTFFLNTSITLTKISPGVYQGTHTDFIGNVYTATFTCTGSGPPTMTLLCNGVEIIPTMTLTNNSCTPLQWSGSIGGNCSGGSCCCDSFGITFGAVITE